MWVERKIESLPELIEALFNYDEGCVFRGQRDAGWGLESTVERAVGAYSNFGYAADFAENSVKAILKSRIHHYIHRDDLPQSELGWLSIAQHHGSPTRMLDFTRFPLVALYFAAQGLNPDSPNFALWVVNFREINDDCENLIGSDPRAIDDDPDGFFDRCEIAANDELRGLWIGEPSLVNLRLERQGGTFMIPTSRRYRISECLEAARDRSKILMDKLVVSPHLVPEVSTYLSRAGVTASRLFDGVDGLAREASEEIHRIVFKNPF